MFTSLYCQQKPLVIDEMRRFLDETLRPRAHRSVNVEAEVVELPRTLALALTSTGRKELTEEERLRVVVRAFEITRQIDPKTPTLVRIDQPWSEFLSRAEAAFSPFNWKLISWPGTSWKVPGPLKSIW